jgi:YidC/Oxa1 family membrane protein insertase
MLLLLAWQPLTEKLLSGSDQDVAAQDQVIRVTAAGEDANETGETSSQPETSAAVDTIEIEPVAPAISDTSTNAPATATAPGRPEAVISDTPSLTAPRGTGAAIPEDFEEERPLIETEKATFEFSTRYGGLSRIYLKEFQRIITCDTPGNITETNRVVLNDKNQFSILGIENLKSFDTGVGYKYSLDESRRRITFWKDLPSGLQLANEFRISTNLYQVTGRSQIKNASGGEPVKVPQVRRSVGSTVVTTAGEMDVDLRLSYLIGDNYKKTDVRWFENKIMGCIPGQPRQQYIEPSTEIRWAAMSNQFFTLIVEPRTRDMSGLVAVPKDVVFQVDNAPRSHKLIEAAFFYPEKILAPGEAIVHEYDIYAGPKSFKILNQLPEQKHRIADFGFFGFFSKALLLGMNTLHSMGLSYALSILTITFIIKMAFWPLTHASTKSMKRMAKLQPQMKEIQEKYKEDPTRMQQKLMKFMKDNKVNPMGGCLPMLLQMPVFIGFFFMIRTAIELRGESFLWICDLSQSDTVASLAGFPINPMPILMGVTMLIQTRLTPPAAGMDPMQANMMRYMPLLFVGILYNYSSGLTMYWTFQNILSIVQTKLTRIDESKLGEVVPESDGPSPAAARKPRRPKTWMEAKTLAMKQAQKKKKGKR